VEVNLGHTGPGYYQSTGKWILAILANSSLSTTLTVARPRTSDHLFTSLCLLQAERYGERVSERNPSGGAGVKEDYTRRSLRAIELGCRVLAIYSHLVIKFRPSSLNPAVRYNDCAGLFSRPTSRRNARMPAFWHKSSANGTTDFPIFCPR
jgi:hypothetical protein